MGNSAIRFTQDPDSTYSEVGPEIFLFIYFTPPGLRTLAAAFSRMFWRGGGGLEEGGWIDQYVRNHDFNTQPIHFFMINIQTLKISWL